MKGPLMLVIALALIGCAHVVPKETREKVHEVEAAELFRAPEAHKGKTVMLGGVIVSSTNTDEGTLIEVLERPLDRGGSPEDTDVSRGRFIAFSEKYLDTAIYSRGRRLTVVGEVEGKRVRPLGETEYGFLFIKGKEIYLFKPSAAPRFQIGIGIFQTF